MANRLGRLASIAVFCALLASCGGGGQPTAMPTPVREDWKIHSRVDVRQGPLDPGEFSLIVPYALDHLYGGPNSDTYITATVDGSNRFELDLNQGHDKMIEELESLEETTLLGSRIRIEPPDARIATISPELVDRRFKTLGIANWVDRQTDHTLRLIYFDRPSHLTEANFDVQVPEAGYVWVETPPSPGIARVVPQPRDLVLAFYRK